MDLERLRHGPPHPLRAILMAFPIALFSLALATDVAYLRTEQLQWTNFSAWAIVGALLGGAGVFVWSLVEVVRSGFRPALNGAWLHHVLVLVFCLLGLVNSFQHSRDGWSSVGTTGLVLSILSLLAALGAAWILHSRGGAAEASR
ncbi:MAG TPA: DUF2231 domain-containing protein [Brevundimonas sp.]|jgi:uncharacterized membrane protein|uniref:DUF2231 domain-containing protein n=1 Tax=Brevundimonas sp. TaxID=1871086 RepID=UPI002DEC18D2|nr:DUF2231 domain-containing protein [Brevundimonas sp.]